MTSENVVWPSPIRAKMESWDLPPELLIGMIETLDNRLRSITDRHNGTVTKELWTNFAGEPKQIYVWAAYTYQDSKLVVTDCGMHMI